MVESKIDAYTEITPLSDFNWKDEEPIRLRPFKPAYHLTMALENMPFSELVAMDKTYLERIRWRRKTMNENPSDTVKALPGSEPLINELYTWLFGTYLPRRFPNIYILIAPKPEKAPETAQAYPLFLRNRILNESVVVTPPEDPEDALATISAHIDTDFLLLDVENRTSPEMAITADAKYHLVAYASCCPSGFAPADKIGKQLAAIHGPVPQYPNKLEKSMDRFFATLPVGKMVKRSNWTITTHDRLFTLKGNHFVDGEGSEAEIKKLREDVKVEDCRLRTERQTLHRLEHTGGLVFAFKSYLYPLSDIKDEGLAEDLAQAIEGFAKGSVPEMAVYKRQVVWGDKVVAYLRS